MGGNGGGGRGGGRGGYDRGNDRGGRGGRDLRHVNYGMGPYDPNHGNPTNGAKRSRDDGNPRPFFDTKSHPDGENPAFNLDSKSLLSASEQAFVTKQGRCFYCGNKHHISECRMKQTHLSR